MKLPEMAPGFYRDRAAPYGGPNRYQVKPYGYLTGFELTLEEPIPNMDAAQLLVIDAVLYVDGTIVSFRDVWSHHRSVTG